LWHCIITKICKFPRKNPKFTFFLGILQKQMKFSINIWFTLDEFSPFLTSHLMYQTRFIVVRYKNPSCYLNSKIFKSVYLQKKQHLTCFLIACFFLTKCFIFQQLVYIKLKVKTRYLFDSVSEWLLLNAKWAIFHLLQGRNELHIMSALY